MSKKTWKKLLGWLKEYKEELIFFLIAVGLTFSVQLIGCNEVAFYQRPQSCADFDMADLESASCEVEQPVPPSDDIGTGTGTGTKWAGNDGPDPVRSSTPDSSGIYSDPPRSRSSSHSSVIRFNNTYYMGVVDIIFVIDNSRSMYPEQQNIANQFDEFLDSIQDLDYRIAMMTVDISDSPNNRDRTYQDGHFIEFGNRRKYLSNDEGSRSQHRENIRLFKEAVQRPESLSCMEKGRANECPDDERAICALNKSLDISSQRDFFRKPSHLMVVILSDEDEKIF